MSDKKEPVVIYLEGRLDANNSEQVEKSIQAQLKGKEDVPVILNAAELQYISSSGLRVLLRLKKNHPDLRIIEVHHVVYEILEMTGLAEMMTVEKAFMVVSLDKCEVIGEGANGKVYRYDEEHVIKTYKNADALSEILHEREVARLALILGIPTAISFTVVRVGDSYGSVFELLDARSFAKILAEEPERMDWCVQEYVKMMRLLHSTAVPDGKLPSMKELVKSWAAGTKTILQGSYGEKLEKMVDEIPEDNTMIHGDYHTKNIVISGDEVMLIDMDTLSVGHPIFELAQMYNSYIGFSEYDPQNVKRFQGYEIKTAREFWKRSLREYLNTADESRIREIEDKIRCVSYARLIDWSRRHKSPGTEKDLAERELWISELKELLDRLDTLVFELGGNGIE